MGWGRWSAKRGLVCSSSNYVPSHCTALAGCNYTHSYTMTHCFWLQLQGYTFCWLQLQSYTWFLAAITHSYIVFGCNYIIYKVTLFLDAITHTHTVTHNFWLQLHSDTMVLAAITQLHIFSGCNYIHSDTFFLAAISHTVTQ